jgi:hypothetical protein
VVGGPSEILAAAARIRADLWHPHPVPPQRPRNISRVDHHYFHGWRVCIKRQRRCYERYFKDSSDRGAALARAIRWRDETLAHLPPLRKFQLRKKPTQSGVVGVSRDACRTRAGTLAPRYVTTWSDEDGRPRRRTFSVLKYGEAHARKLAISLRRQALAEILRPRKPRTVRSQRNS